MKKPLGMKNDTTTRTSQRRTFGPHQLQNRLVERFLYEKTESIPYPFWIAARLSFVSFTPINKMLRMAWNKDNAKQILCTWKTLLIHG